MCQKSIKTENLFPSRSVWREALRAVMLHLSTSDDGGSASPLSISSSDRSTGGVGVLQPWKKQATHRIDCVIIAVIQSGPHTHAHIHVWRVGVECQISAGLAGGGCGAGLRGPDGPLSPAWDPRVTLPWNNPGLISFSKGFHQGVKKKEKVCLTGWHSY